MATAPTRHRPASPCGPDLPAAPPFATPAQATSPSLRSRLLRRLWWPLLAVLMLSAVYDYRQALRRARDNQDLALERVAVALASRLDVDADDARDDDLGAHLTRTAQAMQRADTRDQLAFAVQAAGEQLLGGEADVLALGDAAPTVVYADRQWRGRPVRVVTWPHLSPLGPVTVVVVETTERRQAEARSVLADTVWPNLLLMLLAVLLVHRGVRVAMAPLDRLDRAVAARAPDDLSPLPATALPAELLPLVQAISRLMGHLRASAHDQQLFLSNAAHQLRTPLAGMQTQIDLALQDAAPASRDRLNALDAAVSRMARLTHQMLALARSGSDAVQAADFHAVDLRQLLEDAASDWLDRALAAQVDLGFDAQPAVVRGSAWMLHELLGNLIDNALRHSPVHSQVTVRCGLRPDGQAWLSVEDAGWGIAPADQARVFNRFFRGPTSPRGGAGLGLAIVREVAMRHQGEVTLAQPASGMGLLVTVSLPGTAGA